jgi:hypothetical protein
MRVNCPVCRTESAKAEKDGDVVVYICRRCGKFRLSDSAEAVLGTGKYPRTLLSGWIREQTDGGDTPDITSYALDRVKHLRAPPLSVKLDRFLLRAAKLTGEWGGTFQYDHPELQAVCYARSIEDLSMLIDLLSRRGYLGHLTTQTADLMPEGLLRVEELSKRNPESKPGFVAMSFADELRLAYAAGIDLAVRDAGYLPMRLDLEEHANRIDDEIVVQIRRSRFMVADFTGHRGGVYFEAGYGLGLGIPVIMTCRADDMDDRHFDIRQFNCIDWTDESDLRIRLCRRIEAVVGDGPLRPRE